MAHNASLKRRSSDNGSSIESITPEETLSPIIPSLKRTAFFQDFSICDTGSSSSSFASNPVEDDDRDDNNDDITMPLSPHQRAIKRVCNEVLLRDLALETQQVYTQTPKTGYTTLQIGSMTLSDAESILSRAACADELFRLFKIWYVHPGSSSNDQPRPTFSPLSASPHKNRNAKSRDAADRARFHTACYDLWKFNFRHYRHYTIPEQMKNLAELSEWKHAWLRALAARHGRDRVRDLARLVAFLEDLVHDAWAGLPGSVSDHYEEDAMDWGETSLHPLLSLYQKLTPSTPPAQEAVIAWGPDLALHIRQKIDRQIKRRDFRIGHAYLQKGTISEFLPRMLNEELQSSDEVDREVERQVEREVKRERERERANRMDVDA
ncbi:MAG: hypothetical protein M1833_001905 [Piccolia ochrophora]|nr:MAG: hypothetical protein M1833_001905 [Piccolia ochrophora]